MTQAPPAPSTDTQPGTQPGTSAVPDLRGQVAVVTGASRGVGKGVALGLAEAGATVYLTGRSTDPGTAPFGATLQATAQEVEALGGTAVPVALDHADDDAVAALFAQVRADHGRLDVLVNNVFTLPSTMPFGGERFWQLPLSLWDDLHGIGLRAHYVASVHAAPIMVEQGHGLIVNISSFGGRDYTFTPAYGTGKAAVDRLARDMSLELQPFGVAAVALYPGIVRTETIMSMSDLPFDVARGESPQFTGRAVAALAADPKIMTRTGQVLVGADLAREYGFTDLDGTQPQSLGEFWDGRPDAEPAS